MALEPHESVTVTLPVAVADLAFFDEKAGRFEVDPGRYGLQLSASSADNDIKQQTYASVSAPPPPAPAVVTAKPVAVGDEAHGITQRVRFPAGSRIDPRLTVALTDQTLLHPGDAGLTVHLSSNRPDVVSADLKATHPGVATITAEVAYNGVTATGSFVVVVT